MTDTIEQRLRNACDGYPSTTISWPHRILHEAADEIERLKADLKRAIERDSGGYTPDGKTWKQAVFDEAAKRGEAERLLSEAWEKAEAIATTVKNVKLKQIMDADNATDKAIFAAESFVASAIAAAIRSSAPRGGGG